MWRESPALIGGATRTASVGLLPDAGAAQSFVAQHWDYIYASGDALFIHYVPSILGPPIYTPGMSGAAYRPTPQPPEVWFVSEVSFADAWSFAKGMAFVTPKLNPELLEACDRFLTDLASRHPIGVEAIDEGVAIFRRHNDGGAFTVAEMRKACKLNVAVLGGPQDATHTDRSMPRHFVKKGFFYFGV